MLQPVELRNASKRFPDEIAELHSFLVGAEFAVESSRANQALSIRVINDSCFRRDLILHLSVLLDEHGPSMRPADLVAMVAIAAAGVEGAATIAQDDASVLLRLVMEAKRAAEGASPKREDVRSLVDRESATRGVRRHMRVSSGSVQGDRSLPRPLARRNAENAISLEDTTEKLPTPGKRRRKVVLLSGLCFMVGLLTCFLLVRRHSAPAQMDTRTAQASITPGGGVAYRMSGATTDAAIARSLGEKALGASLQMAKPLHADHGGSYSGTLEKKETVKTSDLPSPSMTASAGAEAVEQAFPRQSASIPAVSGSYASDPHSWTTNASKLPNSGVTSPRAVSADVLSKRLDSPRLPSYAYDAEEASRSKYPHLLRRPTLDGHIGEPETGPVLSADLRAPDAITPASMSRRVGPAAVIHGTVRSTCLGTMAGNLVYDPAPSYPAAAAAAGVQGTVRIQATVDRDGTINAARVMSGPPLLRDAALDAVQRWRYKPYLSSGKPNPTSTVAIVEFQLP